MPSQHRSHIIFLVDRSGSMSSHADAARSMVNNMLRNQRTAGFPVTATMQSFAGDHSSPTYVAKPVQDCPDLDSYNYSPNGGTNIYDNAHSLIVAERDRIRRLPESQRPTSVMFCFVTDGENGNSRRRPADIKALVEDVEANDSWKTVFMSSAGSMADRATMLGVNTNAVLHFDHSNKGFADAGSQFEDLTSKIQQAAIAGQSSFDDIGFDEDVEDEESEIDFDNFDFDSI